MFALWASLRTFGIQLSVGKLIIAYSTGYAATRRSLPLGGAGATEALMTYALYWLREPLAPSLAGVLLYRTFNFFLIAIPAVIAHRQLFASDRRVGRYLTIRLNSVALRSRLPPLKCTQRPSRASR
jgi:hypothetical protein